MKLPRLLSLSLIFVFVFAASSQAEWWKPSMPRLPGLPAMPGLPSMPRMPNLNPFQRASSHPAAIAQRDDDWQSGSANQREEPQATPSMWQRVSSGTQNSWCKTKSALTPWRAKPQPEEELIVTGSNSSFARIANGDSRQPAKKPFWAWGNEEDDEPPQKASSVSDFIGGRRPD